MGSPDALEFVGGVRSRPNIDIAEIISPYRDHCQQHIRIWSDLQQELQPWEFFEIGFTESQNAEA